MNEVKKWFVAILAYCLASLGMGVVIAVTDLQPLGVVLSVTGVIAVKAIIDAREAKEDGQS